MNEDIIKSICTYLLDNINKSLTIDEIAFKFHYNKFYLIRKFKEYTGFTVGEFVNECRVFQSIDPLIFTSDTILKIALNHGFNSLEYYSEMFKNIIGVSPLNFRQMFSILSDKAENTKNIEELVLIRDEFEKIKDYQNYLDNFSADFINDGMKKEKPKVMIKLQ